LHRCDTNRPRRWPAPVLACDAVHNLFVEISLNQVFERLGRKEAKRRFVRAEMDAWLQARGVTLSGADLDESPMAYRRRPEVIAQHAGTVKVLHMLRPFAVAMAGAGEFDPFKD